jgi:hypothetical protein
MARDPKGHYTVIKGSVLPEDIIILNLLIPNNTVKQNLKAVMENSQWYWNKQV